MTKKFSWAWKTRTTVPGKKSWPLKTWLKVFHSKDHPVFPGIHGADLPEDDRFRGVLRHPDGQDDAAALPLRLPRARPHDLHRQEDHIPGKA